MKNNNNKAFNSHVNIKTYWKHKFFQYITAVEQAVIKRKIKLQKGRHYQFLKYVP